MPPGLLHAPFAVRFVLAHEAERMEREKAGIALAAIGHALIHPRDARLNVLKHGYVLRAMKDLRPDALHSRRNQISLGIKIVVDGADRHPAGRRDRPNTDRRPALPPDQLPTGLQYLILRRYDRIHAPASILNNVHFYDSTASVRCQEENSKIF